MMGDFAAGYLDGLPSVEAEELARANKPGLAALRKTLASGEAVAFLGARASVPLYPMWDELITELVDAAEPRLGERQAATCRVVAQESSEEVVEIVRSAACFRDGDYLTELATTLTDLAGSALAKGDLDAAEHHVAEAITIAAPGKLVPAHSAALAARSRIRAARAAVKVDPDLLRQGRDAADAAMRLAVRHRLAWHELAAMRAHLLLDEAEHADHGWGAKASTLHARLVPPGLDHDPLRPGQRPAAAD